MRKFVFSKSMQRRANVFGEYRKRKVGIASNTDVFLFKLITEREGDLEDMNNLVRAGIDKETLLQEVENQRKLLGKEIWVTYLDAKLDELEERHGVSLSVKEEIGAMAREVFDKLEVTLALKEREMNMEELEERVEIGKKELEKIVEDLLSRKIIKRVAGKFKPISDTL
jgi:hypothetical protein